ncbi:MAG: hypothetical protein V1750_09365 [Acidobacteriota bacterium]
MKKLLFLLLISAVGFMAYRFDQGRKAPLVALEKFADEIVRGRADFASRHAIPELPALENPKPHSLAYWHPAEALLTTAYQVESEVRSPAGDEVTLKIRQGLGFDPPGAMSATRGAMRATFRVSAVVRKTADGWKVAAYESEFLGAEENRPVN